MAAAVEDDIIKNDPGIGRRESQIHIDLNKNIDAK